MQDQKKDLTRKKQYDIQYAKEKLKRIPLDVSKVTYERIKAHAAARGESVNGFIKRAISETMERDQVEKHFEEAAADDSTETVTLEEYKEQSKTDTHG